MSSYRRNDSVGRLRDVHQLDGAMLVSYGIKFHEDMALLTNKLAKEISGRELLRKLYPTSDIAFCSGNGDDRLLARARNSRAMVPVRPSPSLAKLLNLTTVGDVAEGGSRHSHYSFYDLVRLTLSKTIRTGTNTSESCVISSELSTKKVI